MEFTEGLSVAKLAAALALPLLDLAYPSFGGSPQQLFRQFLAGIQNGPIRKRFQIEPLPVFGKALRMNGRLLNLPK